MTNGEKIKEIFPNIIKYGNILIDDTGALQKNILFDDTWWNSEYIEPTTKNDLPHCQCTDAEIAKSFLEDVEAVKDQIPCGNQMDFPDTFEEFAKDYGFTDKKEIYTNGSELIPVFRVKQWLEHISTTKNDLALIHTEGLDEEIRCTMCTNHIKSDRGCDGSCVVDKDMYKAVMDAIEKRIQPTTKNDLSSELEKNSKKLEKDFGELDCISRADAIKAMQDKSKELKNEDTINGLCGAVAILFDLPSITPIRPKGHWIDNTDLGYHVSICSNCSWRGHGDTNLIYKPKYCPNCGADMRGEQV